MNIWRKFINILGFGSMNASCHGESLSLKSKTLRKITLVGNPNVGKSALFNKLTGAYVTVSNYPGTTVNVSKGKTKIESEDFEIIDTPGMYSLLPITEEERVARSLLFEEKPAIVIHVVDSKSLERMLPLTIQLVEAAVPVILNLNMMDEAERAGIGIDVSRLEKELDIPVVATVATTSRGLDILRKKLEEYAKNH